MDDSGDYELLKVALLNRYRLMVADFRNKFRQAKPQDGESFSQFGIGITGYLNKWIDLEIVALDTEQHKGMLNALGRVSCRPDTNEVLHDSGCSTMVITEDLCDPRDFTGWTRGYRPLSRKRHCCARNR